MENSKLSLNPDQVYIPTRASPIPACLFIAQLPLKWIESILCSNQLPIENEFLRYELTKAIFRLRSAAPDKLTIMPAFPNSQSSDLDLDDSETVTGHENASLSAASLPSQISLQPHPKQEKENNHDTEGRKEVKGALSSILKFFSSASSGKKRKLDNDTLAKEEKRVEEHSEGEAAKLPLPSKRKRLIAQPITRTKKSHSPIKLPATLSNIYENGIIYTYMNFAQLG